MSDYEDTQKIVATIYSYADTMKRIRRERETTQIVQKMDTYEIVETIHSLEDSITRLTDDLERSRSVANEQIERLQAECERLRNQLSVANAYARGSKNI